MGSNEPLEGVSTTASAFRTFHSVKPSESYLNLGRFPHTTKKTKETKVTCCSLKAFAIRVFLFLQHTLVLLFAGKKRTTLKWGEPQKLVKPFVLENLTSC